MALRPQQGKIRILVVEDDQRISGPLVEYLEDASFSVSLAGTIAAAGEKLAAESFPVVLLDLGLPDGDGMALAREISQSSTSALIIVSAKAELIDRVVALELGADDYIVKPFHLREVLARIRSVLRRRSATVGEPPVDRPGGTFRFAGWSFNPAEGRLYDESGGRVTLGLGELRLLHAFVANPGETLTRDQLYRILYDREMGQYERAVDIQVSRLRRKLNSGAEDGIIRSVRGRGYVFTAQVTITDAR